MRKQIFLLIMFLGTYALLAQPKPQKAAASKPTDTDIKLQSPSDTLQYSLGAYLGQFIAGNGFTITNANLFIQGMNDALGNKSLMVDTKDITARISQHQSNMTVERSKALEKKLFEAVKEQPGIGMMPDGVCYSIIKSGNGLKPQATDSVKIHIKGFLPDGRLIEDTYAKNIPYHTTPAGLIPGISEIVQIMPGGSLWKVFIPSASAYGEKGLKDIIPPYSALVYELELLK